MPMPPGSRLGPYEIVAPLGAGGMGEVYRARDTRLGRDVAVKVVPHHLSANPEIRARFEREARTVSSLNHPNICTLFDVGREGDTDFLVMELIEGDTLSAKLARGPLPTAEVLRLGAQIADALDRAHRAGVVHRDLKPGNVMLTRTGAKLMDFGLARAVGLAGPASVSDMSGMTQSPTMAQALTAEGTLVGTFQYMSPEQLEGNEADARSDLWALGCVLYEMSTGRRAYQGKSQALLISAIMTAEPPPIASLAPMTPPALARVVGACLAKEPDERIQTAHDVKLQLDWIREAGSEAGVAAPVTARRKRRERVAWVLAAVGIAVAAMSLFVLSTRAVDSEPVIASIDAPAGTQLRPYWSEVGLSPDGRTLAFTTFDSLGASLWIRRLASVDSRRVATNAFGSLVSLFWSHDSRYLAYFGSGKLNKIALDGGSPVPICDARGGRGGAWNRDGVIVFAPLQEGPLLRVQASGGESAPATTLDTARHETSHRFPCFLPDQDHFLYVALPPGPKGWDTYVGSLKSKVVKRVLTAGSAAVYAEPGYLVFARDGRIMAQRFDAGRLEVSGEAVAIGVAPQYSDTDAEPVVSASGNGHLIGLQSQPGNTRLEWIDRTGAPRGTITLPPGPWWVGELSPDGRRVGVLNNADIWIVDLERSMPTRLAPTMSVEATLTWSPDGKQIAFVSKETGRSEIFLARADGGGAPELVPTTDAQFKYVSDWSPDGKYIVFQTVDPATQGDLWLLPTSGDRKPIPFLNSAYGETGGEISPDGRWITYVSDESGAQEVYVQSFPEPGHKVRISKDGGLNPGWSGQGNELLYGSGSSLMVVQVEADDAFNPGSPRALFAVSSTVSGLVSAADGERFLISQDIESPRRAIQLFLHWSAALKQQPAR